MEKPKMAYGGDLEQSPETLNGQTRPSERLFHEVRATGDWLYPQRGEMTVPVDDNKVRYVWKPVVDIPKRTKGAGYEAIKERPDWWRELIGAEITHQVSGEYLDVFSGVSPMTRIFFQLYPDPSSVSGEYFRYDNVIQLQDSLNKPYMLLVLLQQVELATISRMPSGEMIGFGEFIFTSSEKRKDDDLMMFTRDSVNFASHQIEPFLSDAPESIFYRGAIRDYVDYHVLGSAEDMVKSRWDGYLD